MTLRKRTYFQVIPIVVFFPFCMIVLFSVSDTWLAPNYVTKVSSEVVNATDDIKEASLNQMLVRRLSEHKAVIQSTNLTNRAQPENIEELSQHTEQMKTQTQKSNILSTSDQEIRPEIKAIIANMSGMHAASGINPSIMLNLPSSYNFLPHLLDNPSSLRLAYLMSKNRKEVSVILGIPTVKREKVNYLMDTLQNLIESMTSEEANDSLIVVFVGETDLEYVLQVAKDIEIRFPIHVDSGLIEVVSPSPAYYPNFDTLRITLNDPPERVRWRSKQNLDFAFLMSYCQPKGTFYVQLEDDILAKPSYITNMKKFAMESTETEKEWIVLDFCQLGFIGKMFKCADLPWLIEFFQMFYNDKPVDWLLDNFVYVKIYNLEKNKEINKRQKEKVWIRYKPSLFQHIGTQSSLKGKIQKLTDKQFGKIPLFFPHHNPEAQIVPGIKSYQTYTLKRAYLGRTFFWGISHQPGDQLLFNFTTPIVIKKFLFKSGNAAHTSDKFYNTTVEVLPMEFNQHVNLWNVTSDGYVVVGNFDINGIATGTLDESIGKIQSLRLNVHSEKENWVVLSEIYIQDELSSR